MDALVRICAGAISDGRPYRDSYSTCLVSRADAHEKGLTRLPTKTFRDDSARAVHGRHAHRMNLRRNAKASKHVDETGI